MNRIAGLSELQIGKAGEYLVCADLLSKGFNAFPSDQGLNYDVIVDHGGRLFKIQVKTTLRHRQHDKRPAHNGQYRFSIRCGLKGRRKVDSVDCDVFAFVAMDRKLIAYLPYSALTCPLGRVKQIIEFKTREIAYPGRSYSNGTVRAAFGKFMEDYADFRSCSPEPVKQDPTILPGPIRPNNGGSSVDLPRQSKLRRPRREP